LQNNLQQNVYIFKMKNRPKFKTERLLLRSFELSDAPWVRELAGEKAIADTTLNIPYPY